MIEESIKEYMGESHRTLAIINTTNGFSITNDPLKYTESMVMVEMALEKLSPDFVEIWNDRSGWNCNLMIGEETFKAKHGETACFAIASAIYNYIRRDNGSDDRSDSLFNLPDTIISFNNNGDSTLLN